MDRRFSTPSESDNSRGYDRGNRYDKRGSYPSFGSRPEYQRSYSDNYGGGYSNWDTPLPHNERMERFAIIIIIIIYYY